jgi:CRP-like cAMP-binding protein
MQFVFGIGPEHPASGQPQSRLIYPMSWFGVAWIFLTAIFLIYTAIVTPPMIAFHWLDPDCAIVVTLPFDCLLDCFFLMDIILTFNTGVIHMGEYIDDRGEVTKLYLKGGFWFDVVTSIPVSFVELAVQAACAEAKSSGEQVDSGALRMIRSIKPLRWFKIFRVLKLGKAAPLAFRVMDYYNISPKQGKTFRTGLMLVITIHILSCAFWLWKVLAACDAVNADSTAGGCDALDDFLDSKIKWGTAGPRKGLDTNEGKVDAYVISMYVVTMTLTTVGYGDITAENTVERVGYTVLFVVGAFVWGNLLAEITEIHSSTSAREQERMCEVQKTLEFLIANETPARLRREIVQWTRFHADNMDDYGFKEEIIHLLPPYLQDKLVRHLYSRVVSRVPVFAYIESVDDGCAAADAIQEKFVSEVFLLFDHRTYTPGDVLVNFSDPADRLVILMSGRLRVEFEHSKIEREPFTLRQDHCFGDMAVLGMSNDWADSSSFNFLPHDTDELTEIKVTAPSDFVVTIQLTREKFQKAYDTASVLTKAAIQDFMVKWKETRLKVAQETIADLQMHKSSIGKLVPYTSQQCSALKITRNWEFYSRALIKINPRIATARDDHPLEDNFQRDIRDPGRELTFARFIHIAYTRRVALKQEIKTSGTGDRGKGRGRRDLVMGHGWPRDVDIDKHGGGTDIEVMCVCVCVVHARVL